jgi:hypothetical protein
MAKWQISNSPAGKAKMTAAGKSRRHAHLQRAGEIVGEAKLMARSRRWRTTRRREMQACRQQAGQLAKMGRISPKQMAKLAAR